MLIVASGAMAVNFRGWLWPVKADGEDLAHWLPAWLPTGPAVPLACSALPWSESWSEMQAPRVSLGVTFKRLKRQGVGQRGLEEQNFQYEGVHPQRSVRLLASPRERFRSTLPR